MSAVHSRRLAARAWWALLPYVGYHCDKENGLWRWWMRPTYWLWKLVGKLPGSDPFEPVPFVRCDCELCGSLGEGDTE